MGLKTHLTVGVNRILARLSLGSSKRVKLQHLLPELKVTMDGGIARIGAHEYAPNHFILYLAEGDLAHHLPLLPALRHAVVQELKERAEEHGWRLLSEGVAFEVLPYAELAPGQFDIDARIVEAEAGAAAAPAPAALPAPSESPVDRTASPRRPATVPPPTAVPDSGAREPAPATALAAGRTRVKPSMEAKNTEVATAVFKVLRGETPGRVISLVGQDSVLGRDEEADVVFADDSRISREHCRVYVDESRLAVEDLGSANGTRVNGRLLSRAFLSSGSTVQIGDTVLELVLAPGLAA